MTALRKELGVFQGLALYLSAVLGTGILVVPALAWEQAGPASLIVWVALGFVGFALAWSFAAVGAECPNAGGVQSIIARVFGKKMGDLLSWLILFSVPTGGAAAAYIFASHAVVALHLPESTVHIVALSAWVIVATVNILGLKISANTQLVLSSILVTLLVTLVLYSLPNVERIHFHPFNTHGIHGLGQASLLIFWSFLGWEAIAHLAEEFRDPQKDMLRAAWTAAILVGLLYFFVAFTLIGTGSIHSSSSAPLAELTRNLLGSRAETAVAALASIICLATMNAYTAGISRLAYAMARDGSLPQWIGHLHSEKRIPRRAIIFFATMNMSAILVRVLFTLPLKYFFLIPNVSFLSLYILGCLASGRLLKHHRFASWAAYGAAAACLIMLPFGAEIIFYPITVIGVAFVYLRKKWRAEPNS